MAVLEFGDLGAVALELFHTGLQLAQHERADRRQLDVHLGHFLPALEQEGGDVEAKVLLAGLGRDDVEDAHRLKALRAWSHAAFKATMASCEPPLSGCAARALSR